jgi:hypothetical protein
LDKAFEDRDAAAEASATTAPPARRGANKAPQSSSSNSVSSSSAGTEEKKKTKTKATSKKGDAETKESSSTKPYVFSDTTSADQISSLLHEQKTIGSRELEHEEQTQRVLMEEIAELTSVLKESSVQLNHTVIKQNIQLDSIQHVAVENRDELVVQQREIANRTKAMSRSLCGSIAIVLAVMLLFVLTYGVIRLFPKPAS